MKTRLKGWRDWGITNPGELIKSIREKVAGGDMNTQLLVLEACIQTYPGISSYLYESIVHKVSYEKLPVLYITKDDFYGYRRKAVALYKVHTNK